MAVSKSISASQPDTLRVATFNASMDATNYVKDSADITGKELFTHLATGVHPQIKNIAEIIQRIRPDIILINEFDYTENSNVGVEAFLTRYLNKAQNGAQPIDYPYYYTAPVNTGIPSGFDLNRDGNASGAMANAFGFGYYPGHYGMLVLSKYPINNEKVRTFQYFLWKDMPDNLMSQTRTKNGEPWYESDAQSVLRLSSKSHWDIPVKVNNHTVHILASHPTPPVFDGPENRNGHRNHDEIRFWVDYLRPGKASYIYDDTGETGGFKGEFGVILGDLNASAVEGDSHGEAINTLLTHDNLINEVIPASRGGEANRPNSEYAHTHTASWGMRADYAIPTRSNWKTTGSGVFWPSENEPLHRLVSDRAASSDHRLVWVDLSFNQ